MVGLTERKAKESASKVDVYACVQVLSPKKKESPGKMQKDGSYLQKSSTL